jgi:ABC-type lipoprotein export system ATPase subunit
MSQILNDNPSKEDALGRKKFAEQIVKSLTSSFEKVDESIVVGICGKWGSGKTTLLNFIEESIGDHYSNDRSTFRIIHFNPWESNGIEELQRNLLETIIKELKTIEWKENVKKANESFKKYLQYLNYIKFVKYVHPVAKNISDAIEEHNKRVSIASLDDLKKQINSLIIDEEIKVYIIVDDLDRLESEELLAIFKTIKLNTNFLNTCYLIAYDKDVVIKAIKSKYRENASDYLEKIIQVDFTVPAILEEQIEDIFFDKLKTLLKRLNLKYAEQDIFKIWKYHGLREYFQTLRDIKRYFNSLVLSLPNIGADINIGDYISLEAIKVFDFPAYEKLYQKILEHRRKAIWASVSFSDIIISSFEKEVTQSLLKYLFLDKNKLHPLGESLNKKRLSDGEFFERYFSLYVSKTDITESVLSLFFTPGSNKSGILEEVFINGRIKNFLRRISDRGLQKEHTVNDLNLFGQYLKFWDQDDSRITSDLDEYLWNSYFNLAYSFDDRYKAAQTAIGELFLRENEYQPMRFVFNYFITLFKEQGRHDPHFHEEINDQINLNIDEMKENFKKNIHGTWHSYFYKIIRGVGSYPCHLFIHAFAKYHPNEYQRELNKYLENANFVAFLVKKNFIITDMDSGNPAVIKLDNKDQLFPANFFDSFINKIKDRKKGALSEEDEKFVAFFLKEYERE